MSTDSYSDMLRRELDSRFLNSTPSAMLLPPPAPQLGGGNAAASASNLYRPIMPPMSPYPAPAPPGYAPSQVSASSSLAPPPPAPVPPAGPAPGGMLGHLSGLSVPTAPLPSSLPSKSKPGKWNATHVRIAWEIYQNQQRQHPDAKKKFSLTPKLNLNPGKPPAATGSGSGSAGFDAIGSLNAMNSMNLHNPALNYSMNHHNLAGFIPRHAASVPSQQQSPHPVPIPADLRASPAPDQWNRLPRTSPAPLAAPWLTPLVKAGSD